MPNQVNTNTYAATFKDFSGEPSTVRHGVQTLTDNAAYVAARDAYETAMNALLLGNQQNTLESLSTQISSANATSQLAQREIKMLVRYTDDVTGDLYRVSYPTLDLSIADLIVPGTDFLNRETTVVATFETTFEAFVASPDGNAVTIQSIQFVGRNS